MNQQPLSQDVILNSSIERKTTSAGSSPSFKAVFWGVILSLCCCLGALYSTFINAFLGLILGNVSAGGLWFLIDGFTGTQGNILVYH